MTHGTTVRTSVEQHLEPKNEENAIYLSGINLIWRLFSTRPADYTLTQSGLAIPTPERMIAGMEYNLVLRQDSTGGYSVQWGAGFVWDGDLEPEMNTSPNAVNIFCFYCDGSSLFGRKVFSS